MPTYLIAKEANDRMRRLQPQSWWRRFLKGFVYLAVFIVIGNVLKHVVIPAALSLLPALAVQAVHTVSEIVPFGLLLLAVFVCIVYRLERPKAQRAAREVLNEHGIRICIRCGYDLRGIPEDTEFCPECGERCPTVRPLSRLADPTATPSGG